MFYTEYTLYKQSFLFPITIPNPSRPSHVTFVTKIEPGSGMCPLRPPLKICISHKHLGI
jgi:hypothetical protein